MNVEPLRSIPRHPYSPSADLSRFWVVAVISNSQRYKRRYELYFQFRDLCAGSEINLITVEQAFGDRDFMVTEAGNPLHVRVRTVEELWHKENLINIGLRRAAEFGAREVAWIDADVRPAMHARIWFEETWHALQHYEFVQMFDGLLDLDLKGNVIGGLQHGFMANYVRLGSPDAVQLRKMVAGDPAGYYDPRVTQGKELFLGHPGGAWAANMSALNAVGGMIDFAILGSADHYMAYGLLGSLQASTLGRTHSGAYTKKLMAWQARAIHWIKADVGFVPGTLLHDWHGPKSKRGYSDRWRILVEGEFDPDTDLKYDAQGLLQLETVTPRQIKMRDRIRAYFTNRSEDATS